jgi:hypothetical protein
MLLGVKSKIDKRNSTRPGPRKFSAYDSKRWDILPFDIALYTLERNRGKPITAPSQEVLAAACIAENSFRIMEQGILADPSGG